MNSMTSGVRLTGAVTAPRDPGSGLWGTGTYARPQFHPLTIPVGRVPGAHVFVEGRNLPRDSIETELVQELGEVVGEP
jgi:hypothetical protein